jgi:hypothetical protein
MYVMHLAAGLPDFSLHNIPKTGENTPKDPKISTPRPSKLYQSRDENMPSGNPVQQHKSR